MWIAVDAATNGIVAAGGRPTSSSGGSATRLPRKCTSAVSISLSPLDLTSAFQPACSTAPNSTAKTIGQVRAMSPDRGPAHHGTGADPPRPSFALLQIRIHRCQHRRADARGGERAGGLEDRVGDRADVRVDALQVAD